MLAPRSRSAGDYRAWHATILASLWAGLPTMGQPAVEPNIEVIAGQVLIDGIPQNHMLIEGDIIVPDDFYTRGALATNLWPGGVVPYRFDDNVDDAERALMLADMALWEAAAAVDFHPRSGESDFVHIRDSGGDANPVSSSQVGRQGGQQIININGWTPFVMAHELAHCLGYWHEQQRPDRDLYVQIANCQDESCDLNMNPPSGAEAYGAYDFDSVMHYHQCAFSCCHTGVNACLPHPCETDLENCRSITVLPPNTQWQNLIGQRDHLSYWDQRVMAFLYPYANWRFVDLNHGGGNDGTFFDPYLSLSQAIDQMPDGGTLWFLGPDIYPAVGDYSQPMTWRAGHLTVTLGG